MRPELYEEFLQRKQRGEKEEAKTVIRDFIASFQTFDEKKTWTSYFLNHSDFGHRIRHEIYENLVFPVLLDGYERKEAWATLWLARTVSNIYASEKSYESIGRKNELSLLKEAYELEQSEEVRQYLLKSELKWFDYCQHEWPAGILYGINGASLDECREILSEVEFARSLDTDAAHGEFLAQFEEKVRQYMEKNA